MYTDEAGNPHPNQPVVDAVIEEYLKSCQELLDLIPDHLLVADINNPSDDDHIFNHNMAEIASIASYLVIEEELYDLPIDQLVMMVRFTSGYVRWAGYYDPTDG